MTHEERGHLRRDVLTMAAAALASLTLPRPGAGQELPVTPQCDAAGAVTIRQTEGPFFKPRSPLLSDLRSAGGLSGAPVILSGFVLTRSCRPIANALVDLWHADAEGEYDNKGFRGRGHQFTDAQGRYRFVTVRPARYTGRTAHYHVKVQAGNGPVLTTQLYFPGEPGNRRDPLFRPELQMRLSGQAARFDFVLDRA